MDLWEKMVEKVVNVEAKVSLQPLLKISEIDFNCLKGYTLTKKNKDETDWKHRDGDKAKSSQNLPFANSSQLQTQTQASKKNKRY